MYKLPEGLRFKDGLIPAVITEVDGQVLVLCYMNDEALARTLETGLVHVFRRSRGRVMLKGETSGHTQRVQEVRVDCEGNSLLVVARQKVAACHAGYRTCYYRRLDPRTGALEVCEERVFDPDKVYEGPPAEPPAS
jgi:phosphoribosyl-AMP cyclohydrolase